MLPWRVTPLISLQYLAVEVFTGENALSSQSAVPFVTYEIWIELVKSY